MSDMPPLQDLPLQDVSPHSPQHDRPTMHDVARVAGVSHQTVSRVLNGGPNVSEQARKRVLDAIEATRYRRNAAARALVTRRTGNIGVLVPSTAEHGVQAKVRAIEVAARDWGYNVIISSADPTDVESLRRGLTRVLDQPVDGVITVIAHSRFASLAQAELIPLPNVLLLSEAFVDPTTLTDADRAAADEAGARLVTEHLISLGHRRILHIMGPQDWVSAVARAEGYRVAMAAAGLEALPAVEGDWSAETGFRIGTTLDQSEITAVFAANDQMAIGLMHAARSRGIRIPEELSVAGYDDLPESAFMAPPLTTLRKDEETLGRRAVDLLMSRITGTSPLAVDTHTIEPVLIVRESTAQLAPSRAN